MSGSSRRPGEAPTDLELLAIRLGMGLVERGRIEDWWGVTIAAAGEGNLLFLGSELPPELAEALRAAFEAAPRGPDPHLPPPALAVFERVLGGAGGRLRRSSGPSYLIPPDTRSSSKAELILSSGGAVESVRSGNPGNWLPDEWDDLLDGTLGPWAMASIGDRVISICHTPGSMTEDAAECGVWTDPDFRGQGHAAAVTAAWAGLVAPTGRHLFYSTDSENRSSQRVADRLALRLIGWTWSLARPTKSTGPQRHPLSIPRLP